MSDQLGVYKTGLLEGTNDSTDLESVGKLQAFKELPSAGSAIGWKKRRGKHKNPASIYIPSSAPIDSMCDMAHSPPRIRCTSKIC